MQERTMTHTKFLWAVVYISLAAISLFPIYTVFFLAPAFTHLLVEDTKSEAVRLATYISSLLVADSDELRRENLPDHLLTPLSTFKGDGHLTKLRVFSNSGKIIYSTDPAEIGRVNQEAYFRELEERGRSRVKLVPKDSESLEHEVVSADVVETYVPIVKRGRVLGVFELYFNVSKERQDLKRLIYRSYGILFSMTLGLLIIVLISTWKAHESMKQKARADEHLRLLSLTDDLTGLYNRRGFLTLAEQQTKMARRDRKPMMVISADLDGLKTINDAFGHKEGDSAIAVTANILKESFRQSDLIARLGGDEFGILLTAGEAPFDRNRLAQRLNKIVARRNKKGNRPYAISLSVGFAYIDGDGNHTLADSLHQADTMMYEHKRQKRGSHTRYQ